MDAKSIYQYVCAAFLIVSGAALAFVSELRSNDVSSGVLLYIAQAFTLAGSIFGLDAYVRRVLSRSGN